MIRAAFVVVFVVSERVRDTLILGCRIIYAGRSVSEGGRCTRSRRGLIANAARAEQRPGWDGFYPSFLVPVGGVFFSR